MATEHPWEVIRRAADRLETLAKEATPGPWEIEYDYHGKTPKAVFRMDPEYPDDPDHSISLGCMDAPGDNAWVAALSPAVAEPLVAWLRYIAKRIEVESRIFTDAASTAALAGKHSHPIELARRILGEQP